MLVSGAMTERLAAGLARVLAERERTVLDRPDKTVAAVLVPMLEVDGEPHLLYTRRSTALPSHQGQVAFPGGRRDPGDTDLLATALREAHEEIGLEPARTQVLGALDDIETMSTRYVITPFVALTAPPHRWTPSPSEVDAIFTVPLRVLRAPETLRQEVWEFNGRRVPVDTYPVNGHVIWGATQRITGNLLDLVACLD